MSDDRPPRPDALEFQPDAVPDKLTDREQWVAWRYEWDDGRDEWTKIPVDTGSGGRASSTDSDTWTSFADAVAFHKRGETDTDGVGFVVHEEDIVVGIDLDDCHDPETGEFEPWADDLLEDVPTYAEVSPSGTGGRLFGFGFVPDGGKRADVDGADGHLEMYDWGRYLTVTGHRIDGTADDVRQVNDEIEKVHAEYIADDEPDPDPPKTAGDGGVQADSPDANPRVDGPKPGSADATADFTDAELLERAKNAENGAKFDRLWCGDTSGYESHSEADLALCGLLAFWTGGDRARIDRLFRDSDLYRDKWDKDRGSQTYGERTIGKALEGRTEFYEPGGSGGTETIDVDTEPDADDARAAWDAVRTLLTADDGAEIRAGKHLAAKQLVAEFEPVTQRVDQRPSMWAYDRDTGTYRIGGTAILRERLRAELGAELTNSRRREIISAVRELTYGDPDELGAEPHYVCVSNGVIDLHELAEKVEGGMDPADAATDLTVRPHSRDYRFLAHYDVEYDPDQGRGSDAYNRLTEWIGERVAPRDIQTVHEYAGYCLRGDYRFKRALFAVGPTDSGKSTFLALIGSLVDDDAFASESVQDLTNNRFSPANLHGARVNIAGDLGTKKLEDLEQFKTVTGAERRMRAEPKGKQAYPFEPTAKFLFAANQVPDVEDPDDAFYNRWLFAEFPNQIDPDDLDDRVKDELLADETRSATLLWALAGYATLFGADGSTRGFSSERTIDGKRSMWSKHGDSVERFIVGCLELTHDREDDVVKKDAYEAYSEFCHHHDEATESRDMFTKTLTDQARVEVKQRRRDSHFDETGRPRVYSGVQFSERGKQFLAVAAGEEPESVIDGSIDPDEWTDD